MDIAVPSVLVAFNIDFGERVMLVEVCFLYMAKKDIVYICIYLPGISESEYR